MLHLARSFKTDYKGYEAVTYICLNIWLLFFPLVLLQSFQSVGMVHPEFHGHGVVIITHPFSTQTDDNDLLYFCLMGCLETRGGIRK